MSIEASTTLHPSDLEISHLHWYQNVECSDDYTKFYLAKTTQKGHALKTFFNAISRENSTFPITNSS